MNTAEPITRSEELNALYEQALDAHCGDNSELQNLLAPCMFFDNSDHISAADGIDLVAGACNLPQIVELENGQYYGVIWTLLSEKKVIAILNKAIKDAEVADKEQELQNAEVKVATLEKQLIEAKKALAVTKSNKGSK